MRLVWDHAFLAWGSISANLRIRQTKVLGNERIVVLFVAVGRIDAVQ